LKSQRLIPGIRVFLAVTACVVLATVGPVDAATVSKISVEGTERVDEGPLRVEINLAVGRSLDEETVDADIKALYGMGFFEQVWVTSRELPGGVEIVYHVRERPWVSGLVFEGVSKVAVEDLQAVVNVNERTMLDPDAVLAGLVEARKLYSSEGYPDAAIEYSVALDDENQAVVTWTVDEGELVRVDEILFEGVTAFKHRKLRKLMTTRTKWFLSFLTGAGLLNEDELATDVERVQAFYYDHGYVRVRVDEPVISRDGDELTVTIKVNEGPLHHVGEVNFEGDLVIDDDLLRAAAGLVSGDVFSPSALREAVFSLVEVYGNQGYAFADVEPRSRVDPETHLVDLRFACTSGAVVNVRRIDIRGNTKTRDKVIRRELLLREGVRFSGTGLRESKDEVQRTGLFESVELITQRTDQEDELDLLVQVSEGRTGTFAAGAGFSSADQVLFNARISERNLFGRGQRLVLNADVGSIRQNFQFGLTEPWWKDKPLSLGIDLFDWSLEFDRFTRGGTGGALRASYPLRDLGLTGIAGLSTQHVRAGLEYRLEEAVIDGVSGRPLPSVKDQEGTSLTSSISPTLSRNTLDHPFDPTRGSRIIINAEIAGLGGESDFFKVELSGRWYFPIYTTQAGNVINWALGTRLGYGVGDTGNSGEELPLFERYFPGGINSLRGYDPRSLGPLEEYCDNTGNERNCFEESVGGSQQLIVNNEVIFPIFSEAGLKGVMFVDSGNAWTASDGIDPGDIMYSVGWGVRWLSPMGPLRVEIGYPLRKREGDSASVVSFSFGAPF